MKVETDALELIRSHGGRVWVWAAPHRCCTGNMTLLHVAYREPPGRHRFGPVRVHDVEIHFDPGSRRPPEELELETRGLLRRRIDAVWDGCVFPYVAALGS